MTRTTARSFDEAVVAKAMLGLPVPLTPAVRYEAIRRLAAEGRHRYFIAYRLGCSRRTVERALRQHRVAQLTATTEGGHP